MSALETDPVLAGDRVYAALRMVQAIGAEAEAVSYAMGDPMVVTFCWHGHDYELTLAGGDSPAGRIGATLGPFPEPPAWFGDPGEVVGYRSDDLDGMLAHLVDEWGALGVAIKLLAGIPAHGREEWLQRLASGDYMGAPLMMGWDLPAEPDPAPIDDGPVIQRARRPSGEPWLAGVNLAVQLALVAIMRGSDSPLGLDAMVDRARELVGAQVDPAELIRAALGR